VFAAISPGLDAFAGAKISDVSSSHFRTHVNRARSNVLLNTDERSVFNAFAMRREMYCTFFPSPRPRTTLPDMNQPNQPNVKFIQTPDYRETYSNSVQIRVNVWDFFLVFGTMQQASETQVELRNFQGIYLSPQQAKALMALLQQNVTNYEAAFGEIKLDPRAPGGPVH